MEQIRVACKTKKELESVLKTFERMGIDCSSGDKATSITNKFQAPCCIYWTRENYLLYGNDTYIEPGYRCMASEEFLRRFDAKKTIVVYQKDARTVVAVEKSNGQVLKSAKAKCAPEDVFDFQVGAQLALDRLLGKKQMVVKQDRYEVGDKVLIKSWNEMEREYGVRSTGSIDCDCAFIPKMSEWCGDIMTISFITKHGNYWMENSKYTWSGDMIKGKVVVK